MVEAVVPVTITMKEKILGPSLVGGAASVQTMPDPPHNPKVKIKLMDWERYQSKNSALQISLLPSIIFLHLCPTGQKSAPKAFFPFFVSQIG